MAEELLDLKALELAGRKAYIIRGMKARPPAEFTKVERTAWLGGYYRRMGFERARDGRVGMYDTDELSYSSKCRNVGVGDYYRQNALAKELLKDELVEDGYEDDEDDEVESHPHDLMWEGRETLKGEYEFDTDAGHTPESD